MLRLSFDILLVWLGFLVAALFSLCFLSAPLSCFGGSSCSAFVPCSCLLRPYQCTINDLDSTDFFFRRPVIASCRFDYISVTADSSVSFYNCGYMSPYLIIHVSSWLCHGSFWYIILPPKRIISFDQYKMRKNQNLART